MTEATRQVRLLWPDRRTHPGAPLPYRHIGGTAHGALLPIVAEGYREVEVPLSLQLGEGPGVQFVGVIALAEPLTVEEGVTLLRTFLQEARP